MRKIIVSTYITLNGVIESPQNWLFPFWSEEIEKYATDQLWASDALLMGRETYQIFADSWPTRPGEFAARMNNLPKYVVSTTLEKAEWNNSTLIKGNVAEEVARLKQQPGQDILIYGAGDLARTLLHHGLLDELRFWICPVVVGSGEHLFKTATDVPALKLVETRPFNTGVVILSYQPEQK